MQGAEDGLLVLTAQRVVSMLGTVWVAVDIGSVAKSTSKFALALLRVKKKSIICFYLEWYL
jgi:hypothetical protein